MQGEQALALPQLDSETIWLSMSASEQHDYDQAKALDSGSTRYTTARAMGTTVWSTTMILHRRIAVLSQAKSKLDALVADITQLRSGEPHLHAVVFTQNRLTHSAVCERLRGVGFTVYELKGNTPVNKRHQAIREFQQSSPQPKVFVLTMKAGNCGITLTAASRVYLMEPCIDPAHEVQAAGRIHRYDPFASWRCCCGPGR